jgi:hypothetical protein
MSLSIDLVVTAPGAEEIAQLAMLATETAGGVIALETTHTSDPAFDAAKILFKAIVEVCAGQVPHRPAQHGVDRPGIGILTTRSCTR